MSEHSTDPVRQATSDPTKSKWVVWLPILIPLAASAGGAISWFYAQYNARETIATAKRDAAIEENKKLLASQLIPIEIKLNKSKSVYHQLSQNFNLSGYGALESYVIRAKKDGLEKLSLPYALLTDIVQLDSEISALLESYDPYHINDEFKRESDAFIEHAHTYVIRFKSLQNIIATNAPLPTWKPFPGGLSSALEGEIQSRKLLYNSDGHAKTPARSFDVTRNSGTIGGAYSPEKWCADVITQLNTEYPGYDTSIIESKDVSVRSPLRHTEYRYVCTVHLKSKG